MKILVPVKRVIDYNVKPRVKGDGSGVGLAIWRGLTVGAQYFPSRQGTDITVSAYLGAGITADNNIWSFFSKKAV